jgi:pilus assembly protein CpaC
MNKKKLKNGIWALPFCTAVWMMSGTVAWAASDIVIDINQSQVMNISNGISRIAIANPSIADVTVTSGQQLLIVAKGVGSTSLYVWDGGGSRHDYTVVITNQDVGTGDAIQHIIGYPGVKVDKIGGKILLTGEVKDQEQQQRAEAIAKMYSGDVVNMLTMSNPMQIRIEAQIIEISKNKEKDLGVKWGNASSIDDTTGVVSVDAGSFSFGQDSSSSYWGNSLGNLGSIASINANLSLLIGTGDAKILSRPHLVTMSGKKASILIGGEMPVPSTNSNGSTNTEWKQYGIGLDMEPVANEDGLITSKVKATVSTLSEAAATSINGTTLKGLAERSAETVISLHSGETMVIGGLLDSEDSKTVSKIPLLGDLPVIGAFFRSVTHTTTDRELLILITPTLVDVNTTTRVSEQMRRNLHAITRENQQMPTIPKISDSNTVIAQDEYTDEDAAVDARKAEEKSKYDKKLAENKEKRWHKEAKTNENDQLSLIYAKLPPKSAIADKTNTIKSTDKITDPYHRAVATNNANNSITPVSLDSRMNNNNNSADDETPGRLKQRLAELRANE